MRLPAIVLALCLLPFGFPPAAKSVAADTGACPTSPAKLVGQPEITLPEGAKPTAKSIGFEVDIGSDGRVRGLQLVRSSGDPNVDLSVRQTLAAAAYQPPQTGCVAYSGGLALNYALTPGSDGPPDEPTRLVSTCTPYVSAFLTPSARDRKRTGTAIVAVELDAAATRTAAPALRKSTGSPVLDQAALSIAANGHYGFLRGSPCMPQAFTYLLELTFQ